MRLFAQIRARLFVALQRRSNVVTCAILPALFFTSALIPNISEASPGYKRLNAVERCVFQSGRYKHAKVKVIKGKKKKRYVITSAATARSWKKKVAKLKKVPASGRSSKIKKSLSGLNKLLSNYEKCRNLNPTPTTILQCDLSITIPTLNAIEREVTTIALSRPTCDRAVSFTVVRQPQNGTASLDGSGGLTYQSKWDSATDSMSVAACDTEQSICGPATEVSIMIQPALSFSGAAESLAPYRNTSIRPEELRWAVQKLGLNQLALLEDGGDRMSLEDFLTQRLLNPDWVAPDLRATLLRLRDRNAGFHTPNPYWNDEFIRVIQEPRPAPGVVGRYFSPTEQFITAAEQREALERYLAASTRDYHPTLFKYYWSQNYLSFYLMMRARYLSPSAALMTHLLLGHFGVSSTTVNGNDEHIVGRYVKTVERESLGSFSRLLLGDSENGCGDWRSSSGIICDALTNVYLANDRNSPNSPNQNFSRELMELFTLSPTDPRTGLPNYTDIADIQAATGFVSGYVYSTGTDGSLSYLPARHNSNPFNAFGHLAVYYPEVEIKNKTLTPREFAKHLLDNHPSAPYFLARKLFSMLVYPNPSESLVEELAQRFKESNYNIGEFVGMLARSEAFYSKRARGGNCVEEPFRAFTRVINGIGFPLINHNQTYLATTRQLNLALTVTRQLTAAGEQHLGWPTIFSYDYCGRSPDKDGSSEWLTTSRVLGRSSGIINTIAALGDATFNDFRLVSLLGPLEARSSLMQDDVIDLLAAKLQLEIPNAVRPAIRTYLSTDNTGSGVNHAAWTPSDSAFMEKKLAGLVAILASLPASNVK